MRLRVVLLAVVLTCCPREAALALTPSTPPVYELSWDPSPDPTVVGTMLYFGTNSRAYFASNYFTAGVTNITISNLTLNAVYYFTVTAVNQYGVESDYSNEVLCTNQVAELPPFPPEFPDPSDTNQTYNPGDTNDTSGGTLTSTNQAYILGMPPALNLGVSNTTARLTLLGTVGASMAIETTSALEDTPDWQYVTNVSFATPLAVDTNSSGATQVPATLAAAFVPAAEQIELPTPDGDPPTFYRLFMPYSYPVLADYTLSQQGYQTYLVEVHLPDISAHDICYVGQDQAYIDYDNKTAVVTLNTSGATLREIATRVADSLGMNWTSASQFIYTESGKQIVATVVKTEDPAYDPPLSASAAPSQLINVNF